MKPAQEARSIIASAETAKIEKHMPRGPREPRLKNAIARMLNTAI
jgi:hypothetical protein